MPDPDVVQLTGTRVVVRDWRREDLPAFRDWLRPHHEWHKWDGPYSPRPDWRRSGIDLFDPASWSGGRGTEA